MVIGVISVSVCTQKSKLIQLLLEILHLNQPMHVTLGTMVRWTNQDNTPCKIVSDTGNFESPTLNKGDTFTYIFDKEGKYNYYDGLNSSIRGRVIVE